MVTSYLSPGGARFRLVALGLAAFVLLTARFSPDWLEFSRGFSGVQLTASTPEQARAFQQRIFSAYSARGYYVMQQARDLGASIDDPNHKIVRWRLLIPAVGHLLNLPGWVVLGIAHAGCLAMVLMFVAIGWRGSGSMGARTLSVLCFAVVAGASAPFFTSMGLLGYYDSWLAVALLTVGFSRQRWSLLVACLLGPWIDERFVIGLPLALFVRYLAGHGRSATHWDWFKREALWPLLIAGSYVLIRLRLGGSGGSQTVGQYLHEFVFSKNISAQARVSGLWEGLRVGWALVLAGLAGVWRAEMSRRRTEAWLFTGGTLLTAAAGLFTALDMSRSMVLLLPLVPLGWMALTRIPAAGFPYLPPILAAASLLLPANHVVGDHSRPVDSIWSPSEITAASHNNLAALLEEIPDRKTEALAHYREALRLRPDLAPAHKNLAHLVASMPGGATEAITHFKEAIRLKPDVAEAHTSLANLLMDMPARQNEAITHFREAIRLRPDLAEAHTNLAILLEEMPERRVEALTHFRIAARLQPQNPAAHFNLARQLERQGGDKVEVEALYLKAIALDPNLLPAQEALKRVRK